jgi:WD40-like Beta Propeller Repeat
VSLETRARAAAEGLRSATPVDAEAGLARLRHTHRRRSVIRVAASAAVIAGLVGGVALARHEPDRAAPPADHRPVVKVDPGPVENGIQGPVKNGSVVDAVDGGPGGWRPSEVDALPDAGALPYPAWKAFDQDTGRFLYTSDGITGYATDDDMHTVRVVASGQDAPVATIHCDAGCNWIPSFGPGPDEVTVVVEKVGGPPHSAQVYGFDGALRDEFDLAGVMEGSGIADLEWSPDGSRLAVSTFPGAREPGCAGSECEARVWILDRSGGDPVLVYRQSATPEVHPNPPVLSDLAWAPDGERLGLVSATYDPADPATLVAIAVESGHAETLHEFDDCGTCNPVKYGFAWSPDGTRIAVTSGAGIAQLSSDGTVLVPAVGRERGPLAWLVKPPA